MSFRRLTAVHFLLIIFDGISLFVVTLMTLILISCVLKSAFFDMLCFFAACDNYFYKAGADSYLLDEEEALGFLTGCYSFKVMGVKCGDRSGDEYSSMDFLRVLLRSTSA